MGRALPFCLRFWQQSQKAREGEGGRKNMKTAKYLAWVLVGVVALEFLLFAFAVPIIWSMGIICVFVLLVLLFCGFFAIFKSSINAVQNTAYNLTAMHLDSANLDRADSRKMQLLGAGNLSQEAIDYLYACKEQGVRVVKRSGTDYLKLPNGAVVPPNACDMDERHIKAMWQIQEI
jgi:hypothetical protein